MTISIKPTASGSTIEQDGSTILTVDSSGNLSVAKNLDVTGAYNATTVGNKNLIINGDMRIDQRYNGSANTIDVDGEYTLDRWKSSSSQAPTYNRFTVQQVTDAPNNATNSLKVTSLVSYTVTGGDYHLTQQYIEGNNIAHLGWGTSAAKTVTLSFWVKSSLTGTFGGSLRNRTATRSYPFTYTIASADTWENKTVTIPGDTTGTWDTDNLAGMIIFFGLGVGPTYSGTAGSWAGANYLSATGGTSVVGTSGATWQISLVQLEVGSTATPFEHRPYDMELQRCYRYYWQGDGSNYATQYSNGAFTTIDFPTHMRVRPTTSYTSANNTGSFTDYSRTNRFQLYDSTDPTYNINTPKADAEL